MLLKDASEAPMRDEKRTKEELVEEKMANATKKHTLKEKQLRCQSSSCFKGCLWSTDEVKKN